MPEIEIWFFLSIHAYIVELRTYYFTNWKLRAEQRLYRGKYQSRQHGDEDKSSGDRHPCSGSMIPDTNVGGNIATINEVSDDQKATFFFS